MEVKLIAVTRYEDGEDAPVQLSAGQPGGQAERLLERAGRLCYGSRMGDSGAFLHARVREGHLSLVEHATASFYIGGISRAASHQLVRHRLCSFSQRSQRYTSEKDARFVVPPSVAAHPEAARVYAALLDHARETYGKLIALGIPREDSRFALPTATATELIMSFNFREALHIFSLRITPAAQWEIREVCRRMLDQLHSVAPAVFGELRDNLRSAYPLFWNDLPRAGEGVTGIRTP
ncbi:TPA: FAD-dependent thymidylate synthase [Candidatus Acetothermia bacterium]|nr:FAD-dependent thymidylate synthase [Candidatus Acetothermia bacterium]HAZ30190.1 FAD-dependent thymidylate synthase [Candidatus Acetothermia bacterium]